jgi:uncharacterized spore protein YtfJ
VFAARMHNIVARRDDPRGDQKMDAGTIVDRMQDMVAANRVYAEPATVDGTTVILAAKVGGGAGGGTGKDAEDRGEGAGGGLGWTGRPCGAFVLKGGDVRWQPAVDVNHLITAVAAVTIAALLTARAYFKARR